VGFLGEREPFDDPGETHGICARHHAELLAELQEGPAVARTKTLIVVHPRERPLYEYLRRRLAPVGDVEVLLDRRRGERRCSRQSVPLDRRRSDRRRQRADMSLLGYAIVRLRPEASGSPAAQT
jgi:hypothetical protein